MIDWGKPGGTAPGVIDWGADKPKHPKTVEKPRENPLLPLARRAIAGAQWAASSPVARGADTVLNAQTRAINALFTHENPIHAVLDPAHATENTHVAEGVFGLPQWLPEQHKDAPAALKFVGGAAQTVEDMVFETLESGGTGLIGKGLGLVTKALRVPEAAGAVARAAHIPQAAAKIVGSKPVQRVLGAVSEFHKERAGGVLRPGEDIVKGHEISAKDALTRQETEYTNLIDKHRELLDSIDARRAALREQLNDPAENELAKAGYQPAKDKLAALQTQYKELNSEIPAEIRTATLQRAYLEGTPEVRRKVLAKGYVPTADDRKAPVLNILHLFNDEYEPTQKLYKEADLEASSGPVRYVRQGNKKASFDLKKEGGVPEDPLADRLLDRLIRGARLASYHGTRRAILKDLGLQTAQLSTDAQRTEARIAESLAKGDEAAAARYEDLLRKQHSALKAAADKRKLTLRGGSEDEATQQIEFVDPVTARERALRDQRFAGKVVPPKVDPRAPVASTAALRGKIIGSRQAVTDAEQFTKLAQQAAGKIGKQARKSEDAINAERLAEVQRGAKIAGRAEDVAQTHYAPFGKIASAQEAASVPKKLQQAAKAAHGERAAALATAREAAFPKSGWGQRADKVLKSWAEEFYQKPRYKVDFIQGADGKMHQRGTGGGAEWTPTKADFKIIRKELKAAGIDKSDAEIENAIGAMYDWTYKVKHGEVAAAQAGLSAARTAYLEAAAAAKRAGNVPPEVARKLALAVTASEKALNKAYARSEAISEQAAKRVERVGQTPVSLANVVKPAAKAAEAAHGRMEKVVGRLEGREAKLTETEQTNKAIHTMRSLADELGDKVNVAAMPEALKQRLYGTKAIYAKSLLRDFSDLQRDALFIIPFAHKKNITVLALFGPKGPKIVANGMRYASELKANPKALEDRVRGLENIGASAHYLRDVEPAYAKFGKPGQWLSSFAERGNASLERYDMGMRLALEDELKSRGITGFDAGGQIRDILGDYENQAPLIKEMRNRWGANFPAWRLGIVPRAMTKAVRENPAAVQAYARLERLFSDDVTGPMWGADLDLGGPMEDFAGMIFPKPSLGNYYTSESTIGPARSGIDVLTALARDPGKPGGVGTVLGREAEHIIPGGNILGALLGFPYSSTAPALIRTAASTAGAFFPQRLTAKQRAGQLERLGIRGPEVTAILRSEGYTSAPAGTPPQVRSPGMIDWRSH